MINKGILGLEHAAFLSDRIFDIIDENHDGKVVAHTFFYGKPNNKKN